jgi:predicted thioredoxin/glutaredoxin
VAEHHPYLGIVYCCAQRRQIDNLFASIRQISFMGKVIVFISRELDEALPAADASSRCQQPMSGQDVGRPEYLQVERDKTEGIERNPQLMTKV